MRTLETPYPVEQAARWTSVADVFCAAFGGHNSAQYLRHIPRVVLVDRDQQKLSEMELEEGWSTVCEDAYEWAKRQPVRSFDAVILDPWSKGSARVVDELPIFLRIARKHVVVGVTGKEHIDGHAGWRMVDVIHRSNNYGGVYWVVMERE